ncbi:hypothetical protein [Micromonospora sp. WMMD736]|uniref:hypothetical protein n=1 Tax=Micromonospora sp. WMMD736 TaxID=3404112 RepID=UPI003B92B279
MRALRLREWRSTPELVEVAERRPARIRWITTFALEDALDAYRQMRDGTLEGRAVIVP